MQELTDPNNKVKHLKLLIKDQSESYSFPAEDFCLYADFPHSKLIFPSIESAANLECTCTLIWLTQYYPYYTNISQLITSSVSKCNYTHSFDQLVKNCMFEQEIFKCKNLPITNTTAIITSTYC